MVQSRKWNGKSKLNQDDLRSLQDHELDRVSGGFTPRDAFDDHYSSKPAFLVPDGVSSGRRF